jgi:hypothetical protein
MNPTEPAKADSPRAVSFELDGERLPGRYGPRWVLGGSVELE